MKYKIVLDTNVLISSVFWENGACHKVVGNIIDNKAVNYISSEIIQELIRVMYVKFKEPKDFILDQIRLIKAYSEIIAPDLRIEITRDADDNKILECAIFCKADFIVTGDNDLLCIGEYNGIKIIHPKEFLKILSKN